MKIGRFIFNRILSRRQREIILQALVYSAHTYKRRGNVEGYAEVSRVIGELSDKFGLKDRVFTKEEVDEIVENSTKMVADKFQDLAKQAYKKGYERGVKEGEKEAPRIVGIIRPVSSESLEPGMEFSKEKCESCEGKDSCSIYAVLKEEFEAEGAKESEEKEEDNSENETEEKKEQV